MASCVLFLPLMFAAGQQQPPPMPPLTEVQIARLQKLVRTTRHRATELKDKIQQRQNELTQSYAEFDLDITKVEKQQTEILALQKELLANYHHLQVELRSIVGRERFLVLRKRLARVLGVDGPKDQKKQKRTNNK